MNRSLIFIASIALCALFSVGCGSKREAVYKESPPEVTNGPVQVRMTAMRQLPESVAYRLYLNNTGTERLILTAATPPMVDSLTVSINGKSYPSMIAPNELPKEAYWENFVGISGGRAIRDIHDTTHNGGIILEPGKPMKIDMKAQLSTEIDDTKTPWQVEGVVRNMQGKEVSKFTIAPK